MLALEVGAEEGFDAAEEVVNGLAAGADEMGTDDAGDEVVGEVEDLLVVGVGEAFAEDGCEGAGEGLDVGAEGDAPVGEPVWGDAEVDADGVGALFVFADVLDVEGLVGGGGLEVGLLSIGDEGFAFLFVREGFEESDDGLEFGWERGGRVQG